jgi:hypothetical protein
LPEAIPAVFPAIGVHVAAEAVPPVEHFAPCVVAFVGFIPACEPAFWPALPFVAGAPLGFAVDDDVLLCPGAFAEFPGAGESDWESGCVAGFGWELPWPLPWPPPFPLPLPARAEPANATRTTVSTIAPTIPARFVISFS